MVEKVDPPKTPGIAQCLTLLSREVVGRIRENEENGKLKMIIQSQLF